MYSMDKYGKLKKQIDRYFLPLQINPNLILDALKLQAKKNISPEKLRQQAYNKLSQETKRIQLLRVSGKELNSNAIPFDIKINKNKSSARQPQNSPHRLSIKFKLQQILSQPLQQIVDTISKDPDSHMYAKQLEQLYQYKINSASKKQFKSEKLTQYLETEEDKNRDHYQKIIISNPTLHRKMIQAYQKIAKFKKQEPTIPFSSKKRATISQAIIVKRPAKMMKKNSLSQKDMPLHEIKRMNNFIQYRQFLMTINFSNRHTVLPQNQSLYKAFICKGNNGLLVKSIIKTRPWWGLRSSSDIQNCTLVWSQWKKQKLTNFLPQNLYKNQKLSSFYATNYYEKITQNATLQNTPQTNRKQDEKNLSKTDNFLKDAKIITAKTNNLAKIINIQKSSLIKYINDQSLDSSYYTFSRNISDKKFSEVYKRYLSSAPLSNLQTKTKGHIMILNHLPGCLQLHSKKLLFLNMKKFYQKNGKQVFQYLPETHLIKDGVTDPNFVLFIQRWNQLEKQKNDPSQKTKTKNIWICKPGQNSNRGNGITVVTTLEQIKSQVNLMTKNYNRTLIIQKYLENPYLYNKRKFDIRCYLLVTTVNGILKGYFFNEGYIRTTSKQYNLKNLDNKFIHLTNDAIQKKGEQYGKFQSCNKVSFSQFQKYLEAIDRQQPQRFIHARKIIKQLATQLMYAVANKLNPTKKQYCFELFGLDFMLDHKLKPYLIQANSNPCLEVDGSVLCKVIPCMLQNAIRIAIDPLFPPPLSQVYKNCKFNPGNPFQINKFQLIYDSLQDLNAKDNTLKIEDLKELQEQEQLCENQQQNQIQ